MPQNYIFLSLTVTNATQKFVNVCQLLPLFLYSKSLETEILPVWLCVALALNLFLRIICQFVE